MKNFNKIKFPVVYLLSLFIASCENNSLVPDLTDEPLLSNQALDLPDQDGIFPIEFIEMAKDFSVVVEYNDLKDPVKVNYLYQNPGSDLIIDHLIYDQSKLIQIKNVHQDSEIYSHSFEYEGQEMFKKIYKSQGETISYELYNYNNLGLITKIEHYQTTNDGFKEIFSVALSYDENQNLIKEEYFVKENDSEEIFKSIEYQYDHQNNIFKNVDFPLFFFERKSNNNITSKIISHSSGLVESYQYEYVYDDHGFPIHINEKHNSLLIAEYDVVYSQL